PELLGTTREFLDYFGLKSLDQLPTLAELKDVETIGVQLELPAGEAQPASGEEGEGAESTAATGAQDGAADAASEVEGMEDSELQAGAGGEEDTDPDPDAESERAPTMVASREAEPTIAVPEPERDSVVQTRLAEPRQRPVRHARCC